MYDHKKIEQQIFTYWKNNEVYKRAKEKTAKAQGRFYFCDGPPYATGQIHPGTGWNKVIKDAVCRYQRMNGKDVRVQPGYDTHGLPIEVKVEQELGIKNKGEIEQLGIERFVERCKEFATRYIDVMSNQFEMLGVWMDWNNPYITYKDDYIDSSWLTLKMAWDKGLMHEGAYVLPYCYRCETTMANYELEYDEETDPSIFVKFRLKNRDNEFLVIWTTTPWTLVANMAVMAHPTFTYVKVKVDDEIWYLAKDRLEYLMNLLERSAIVLEELPGRKLKDMEYEHPFQDLIKKEANRKIVLSDEYVTLEEGSGLVHCAPGHGQEDFIIGKRFDIEIFSPVDESGRYTEEAGEFFKGKNVREMNPEIIQLLKANGTLLHAERIKHRYPHCWRCKTPLIFLTTKQWFITISKIKEKIVDEIDKIEWHPKFARERFKEFVTSAPDWCISRQRYWGIPLPIWKCVKCGNIKVVGSRNELPKVRELHKPYVDKVMFKCECGGEMYRIPDVLDVWFDSGNAVWASLTKEDVEKYGEISEVIIEGQDQIRGWFYSLIGSGIVRYGHSPYKRVLMHGFFVDEHGEKMSKSLGNFVPLEEIIEKYGADTFRLWSLSNTVWEELKFSWDELKTASGDLNILYNLAVFLERFYPEEKITEENKHLEFRAEDRWLISRLNTVVREYRTNFENYEINRAVKILRSFIVEDVSRFYMKIAKDRIANGESATEALCCIYNALLDSIIMLTPITPFITEYVYQKFFRKFEKEISVSLLPMPIDDEGKIDKMAEKRMEVVQSIISAGLLARQAASIKTRWPVRTIYIETKSHEVVEAAASFKEVIATLLNAKEIKCSEDKPHGEFASSEFEDGLVHISKRIDEELYEEGIVNELKRRIQNMRKSAGLIERDKIKIIIRSENEIERTIRKHQEKLRGIVNASEFLFEEVEGMEENIIDGRTVKIKIKKTK
ncbi:MAG: isoleucine--tRNA ligase [Candidatus Bilamarchaeaceae archaeon]